MDLSLFFVVLAILAIIVGLYGPSKDFYNFYNKTGGKKIKNKK